MYKTICLPILSIRILFYIRLNKANSNCIIYYELMPKYIRGFIKLFNISEAKILSFFRIIFRYKIKRIQHGDSIKDYNIIRRNIYVKITDICGNFISQFKNDHLFNSLEKLIHKSVVIPTAIKFLSHKQLHIHLLSAKLCLDSINQRSDKYSNIIMYNNYYWSDELLNIIKNDKYFSNIEFKKLPNIFDFTNKIKNISNLFTVQLKYILKRGIVFSKIHKKSFKIAIEIFDLKMLGGSCNDTDFFIDNKNFTHSSAIFYITEKHRSTLRNNGYSSNEISKIAKSKGFNITELNKLPVPFESFLDIFIWNLGIFIHFFTNKNSLLFNLLPDILDEHIDYGTLFQHFDIENHIHFINPNGRASVLLNSGIITGLCREYDVVSCGIQNRLIHSREYEFCFDSYDKFFAWGKSWVEFLGSTLCFIKKIIIVGSFNLSKEDFISSSRIRNKKRNDVNNKNRYNVLIFPCDIDLKPSVYSGGFYPISYNINFINACLALSKKYPEIDFNLKLKDITHIDIYKNTDEFKNLKLSNYPNFNILDRPRMKFMDLLLESELVISIGFTTPGIDAILLSKKSIYFNQLEGAGNLFKNIPEFVAENESELILFFDKLINNKHQAANIDLLDPYQDGKAIERIISNLAENKTL